jgi:hypothetical protein
MITGGSALHRPTRTVIPRQSTLQKFEKALQRAKEKLGGEENWKKVKESWNILKTGHLEEDQDKGNGIVISLINLGLSEIEIRSFLGCGSSRISRMKQRIEAGENFVQPTRKPPSHSFSDKTIQFLYTYMESWEPRIEQGFPCPHLRMKHWHIFLIL